MKRTVLLCAFACLALAGFAAHGNGSGMDANNGYAHAAPYVPSIPHRVALRVLHEAQPWFWSNYNMGPGLVLVRYLRGDITITFLGSDPVQGTSSYRVAYGGGDIVVVTADF